MLSFLLYSLLTVFVLSTDYDCTESYACRSIDIDDGYTNITCEGRYSCRGSTFTASENINCPGSAACSYGTVDSTTNLVCSGAYGCNVLEVDTDSSISGRVECVSGNSCTAATIVASTLETFGFNAMRNAALKPVSTDDSATYTFGGGWSANGADIYSNGSDTFTVNFNGYKSAYETTIYCQGGSTCNINCETYACYSLDLVNDGSSTFSADTCSCATYSTTTSTLKISKKNVKISKKNLKIKEKTESDRGYKILNDDSIEDDSSCSDGTSGTWKYCNCEESCSDSTGTLYEYYLCRGFEACSDSTFTSSVVGVYNWGYYAGRGATFNSQTELGCNGYYACYGATVNDVTDVYVSGVEGLSYSTITGVSYLVSSTDYALTGAVINIETSNMLINSFGGNLIDATINVMNEGIGDFYFWGYGSAENAQINCEDDSTCNIFCGENSCDGLEIYVDWSSNYTLNCYDTGSEDCATISREPSASPTYEPTTPTPEPTPEPTDASDEPTQEPTAPTSIPTQAPTVELITCSGYTECKDDVLRAINITCDGDLSCYNAKLYADYVDCDFDSACSHADIYADITYCREDEACWQANVYSDDVRFTVSGAGTSTWVKEAVNIRCLADSACSSNGGFIATNTYCEVENACSGTKMSTVTNVYCSGDSSCTNDCDIRSSTENAYCSGTSSCVSSDSAATNTYCSGESSCSGSNTVLDGDNVYCSGTNSCVNANMASLWSGLDIVECSGTSSCEGTSIKSTEIICSGDSSCTDSTLEIGRNGQLFVTYDNAANGASISNFRSFNDMEIFCTADNSCSDTDISGGSGGDIYIEASGTNSLYGATITCPSSSSYDCIVCCPDNVCGYSDTSPNVDFQTDCELSYDGTGSSKQKFIPYYNIFIIGTVLLACLLLLYKSKDKISTRYNYQPIPEYVE